MIIKYCILKQNETALNTIFLKIQYQSIAMYFSKHYCIFYRLYWNKSQFTKRFMFLPFIKCTIVSFRSSAVSNMCASYFPGHFQFLSTLISRFKNSIGVSIKETVQYKSTKGQTYLLQDTLSIFDIKRNSHWLHPF